MDSSQIPRTRGPRKLLLFSQALDGGARVRVDAERRKQKRKAAAVVEVKLEPELPTIHDIQGPANSRRTKSSLTTDAVQLNAVKERLAEYVGQPFPDPQDGASEIDASIIAQIRAPLNFVDWKKQIQIEDLDISKDLEEKKKAALEAVGEEEVVWEDDEDEEMATDKSIVKEPKRPRPASDWTVHHTPATTLLPLSDEDIVKLVKEEASLDGNEVIVTLKLPESPGKLETPSTPPKYNPRDPAFALDALQRRRIIRERLKQQQEKLLKEEKQKEEERKKSAEGISDGKSPVGTPSSTTALTKAPAKPTSSILKPFSAPSKHIPGRGPPKKELMQRRLAQYGPLLRELGVLDSDQPLPSMPKAQATQEELAEAEAAIATDWRKQVPPIKHSEPAVELEFFEPQFRHSNSLRDYRRPTVFHRENVKVKVMFDAVAFDQARLPSSSAGSAAGVRVDVVGPSASADAALNEIELSVSAASKVWKKKDLSNKNGRLALMEYTEQHPLLLNGVGMQSQVINFYRQWPGVPAPSKPDFGFYVSLGQDEFSPMMTLIQPGKLYRVLRNNMMSVPIVEHKPSSTDFLVVRAKSRATSAAASSSAAQSELCLIRRINKLFVCGQIEPLKEIFSPSDAHQQRTSFLAWLERYMKFHFATRLKRRDDMRIEMQTALAMFSLAASEKMVEKALSELAEREATSLPSGAERRRFYVPLGASQPGKSKQDLRRELDDVRKTCLNILTPEECCAWEQLQLGLFKLHEAGIEKTARAEIIRVTEARKMIRILHELRQQSHDALMETRPMKNKDPFPRLEMERQLKALKYVLNELRLSPWYLSHCYYWLHLHAESPASPFPPRTIMQVTGLGDPSGRSIMVSYLPSAKHVQRGNNAKAGGKGTGVASSEQLMDDDEVFIDAVDGKRKVRKRQPGSGANKIKLATTGDDLRIVSMTDLGDILVALGIPPEQVATIERWDRTWLIEQFASGPNGSKLLGGSIAKYARSHNNQNPSLESVAESAMQNMSPAEIAALRKKVEEADYFLDQRKRVTESFEREMQALSASATAQSEEKGEASNDSSSNAVGANGEEEDDEFDEFAEMLKDAMMNADDASHRPIGVSRPTEGNGDALPIIATGVLPGWQPFKVLKRTIVEVLADGTERVRVEYHKSPEAIEDFEKREAERKAEAKVSTSLSDSFARQRHHQLQLRLHAQGAAAIGVAAQRGAAEGEATVRKKPGRKPNPATAKKAVATSKVAEGDGAKRRGIKGAPGLAPGERARLKAEAKLKQQQALQHKHAEWYREQIERFGKQFYKDYQEHDPRLLSTLPRRPGKPSLSQAPAPDSSRCAMCFLPGHNHFHPLCPLYDPSQINTAEAAAHTVKRKGPKKINTRENLSIPPGPLADLSMKFKRTLDALVQEPASYAFLQRVDPKLVPDYYRVIKNPIDLGAIRQSTLSGQYRRKEAFLNALRLMRDNAGVFNGKESIYYKQAQELLEIAERYLNTDADEIMILEAQIPLDQTAKGTPAFIPEEEEEIVEFENDDGMGIPDFSSFIPEGEAIEEEEEEVIEEEEEEEIEEEEEMMEGDTPAGTPGRTPSVGVGTPSIGDTGTPLAGGLTPSSDLGGGEVLL